jgi:hypothetical protein
MAVDINYIRTEPSNSGAGDTIKDAFDKVNTNFSTLRDVALRSDNLFPDLNDPNSARFANIQVTNRVIGNLFLNPGGQVWIWDVGLAAYQPVATASTTFPGGTVPGSAVFTSLVDSISANTGAVTIYGGLGIRGNIFTNGVAFFESQVTANSTTDSSTISSGALVSNGGLGVAKSVNIGQSLTVIGSTLLSAPVTAQSDVVITSTTPSVSSGSGALIVQGGTGIVGNLNVGGLGVFDSDVLVQGNLQVSGNISFATDTFNISDNIVSIHSPPGGTALLTDDGKDIGLKFHFFKADYGDSHAFAGWANASGAFEYYDRGTEVGGNFVGNTYGVFKGGEFLSVNTTPSISTTTGAIRTSGGIGAAGNIYAGGNVVASTGLVGPVYGIIQTASQPFITGLGVLTSLSVGEVTSTGNITTTQYTRSTGVIASTITAATIGNTNTAFSGSNASITTISATTANVATLNVATLGNTGTLITGTLTTALQPNITRVGTLSNLTVSGTTNAAGGLIANSVQAGTIGNTGAVLTGTISTAAQPNITSVGTLTSLSVGAVTSTGNITTTQYARATGVIANTVTAAVIGNTSAVLTGATGQITNISANTINAVTVGNTGTTLTGTVSTSAQPNITSVGSLTGLTVSGVTNAAGGIVASTLSAGTIGNSGAVIFGNLSSQTLADISSNVNVAANVTVSGNVSAAYLLGDASSVTGSAPNFNANSATRLQSGVFINDQYFDGTQNIQLTTIGTALAVDGANVIGTTLSNTIVFSSLVRLGTLGNLTVSSWANIGTLINVPTIVANTVTAAVIGNTGAVLTGTLSTPAQPNITSVGTLTSITTTGNIEPNSNSSATSNLGTASRYWGGIWAERAVFNQATVAGQGLVINGDTTAQTITANVINAATIGNTNAVLTGTLSTATQPNITSVGTLTALAVTGNVSASGLVGSYFGTIETASQPNITSLGNLISLAVTGNIAASSVAATNLIATNIGNSTSVLTGTLNTAAQTNITSLGTLTGLTVSGTIQPSANATINSGSTTRYWNNGYFAELTVNRTNTGTLLVRNLLQSPGLITANTINAATIGNSSAQLFGTIGSANQPNITSVGTLTALTVTGNVAASVFVGSGAFLSNVPSTSLTNNSVEIVAGTGLSGGGNVALGGSVTINNAGVINLTGTTNQVNVSSSTGNVTLSLPQSINTTASPTFTGITVASITKSGVSASGNIGQSNNRFNTVHARATEAQYADLAEMYEADTDYRPGTVVIFGGSREITMCTEFADVSVAGVISTNPAYLMNAECDGLPVALRGRVPVKVVGPVKKGDLLVTSDTPGAAASVGKNANYGVAVFAKALQDKDNDDLEIIEAVII